MRQIEGNVVIINRTCGIVPPIFLSSSGLVSIQGTGGNAGIWTPHSQLRHALSLSPVLQVLSLIVR